MEKGIITLRLMQTRSLHHIWNRQARVPEMSLGEVLEIMEKQPLEVSFYRRDGDSLSGKEQQRLLVRIDAHLSVEIKSRVFDYERADGVKVRLFSIGGMREVVTPVDVGEKALRRFCRIKLLNWKSVQEAEEGVERRLIDEIGGLEISYMIAESEDVRMVRRYFEKRIGAGDADADEAKRAFNRIVNPEKYGSR